MATYNLIASKDAYTQGGTSANANFGSEPEAYVKNAASASASRKSWFGFNLASVEGTITSAVLKLYCTYGVSQDEDIHLVTGAWTESGITWNTEPAVGDLIDTVTVSTGDVTAIDVVAEVLAALSGGEISFRVTRPTEGGSQDIIAWGTRENTTTAFRPVLVVVTEEEAGASSFAPTDDAVVRAGTHADTPQTNEDPLLVKWSSGSQDTTREVLFRFDLTGIDRGALTSAKLKFYVDLTGEPDQPISVFYCDDSDWDEHTVTWNTRPAETTLLHEDAAVNSDEWIEVDCLAAIQAEPGGAITFLVRRTSSTASGTATVVINSKEFADPAYHPVLVMQEATPSPNPVAVDDSAACVAGHSVSIGVLVNDIATSAALDLATLTLTQEPPNGSASINTTTGRITYTPDEGFTGQDVFRYTVEDQDGNVSNEARVTVTVTPDTSEPYDFEIAPVADTYTRGGAYAGVNYATEPELYAKTQPAADNTRYAFVRFDLSQVTTDTIGEAALRLYCTATGNPEVTLHAHTLPNSWTEGSLTYNNMPSPGAEVGTFTAATGAWSELDVTDAVNAALAGAGIIQFRIDAAEDSGNPIAVFASREHATADLRPQLLITASTGEQNSAPLFETAPVTQATEGNIYAYTARASDPEGTAVTLTATHSVPGLAFTTVGLAPGEGRLSGVPTTPGDYAVTITAADTPGAETDQAFTLVVAAAAPVGDMPITDDAYVQGGANSGTNYGSDEALYIKSSASEDNHREALIRIDCSGFAVEDIGTATLYLFCELAAEAGIVLRAERLDDDEWDEDTVTYATMPAATSVVVGSDVTAVQGQWLPFNITGGAKTAADGDGVLSLRIYATNEPGTNPIVGLTSKEGADAAARPYVTISEGDPSGLLTVDDAFLVAGQSNAMGAGDSTESPIPYDDTAFEYVVATGTFRPLRDPVGGAVSGSAWPAFARKWYELTGRTLALVSTAEGNTPNSKLIRDRNWESGPLLAGTLAAMNAMLEKISGTPSVAVLWSQGERDGKAILEGWPSNFTAETYRQAFLSTIGTFRSQGWNEFVLVISETGTNTELGDVGYADVRQVQREVAGRTTADVRIQAHFSDGGVAESDPVTISIDGGGAEDIITGFTGAAGFAARGMMSDSLHYTQDGYDEMGEAMAHALAVYRGHIAEPDLPPVFDSQPVTSVKAGTFYEYSPLVTGATEVTVPVRPGWMLVTGSGTNITLSGWAPFGTYNVSIRAEGPGGVTNQSYLLTAFSTQPAAKEGPVIVAGTHEVNYLRGSVDLDDTLGQQGTLRFGVNGHLAGLPFEVMDPVVVYDGPDRAVRVFRGTIKSIEEEEPLDGGYMQCRVECIDANSYAERMLITRTYEHMTAGEIVRDIRLRTIGTAFGVGAGTIANGPVIEHAEFLYRKVTEALNALADVAGFMWWIDQDLKLHFNVREAYEAPLAITDANKYFTGLTVTRTMEGYRNRQYVAGDLSAEDPVIALRQDYNEVLSKGEYWDFVQEGGVTQSDADTLAQALLARYTKIPRRIRFTTDEPGLRAGQMLPINLPYRGLNGSFLILAVRASDRGDFALRYDVEATDGGDDAAWAKQFKAYAQARALLGGTSGTPGTEPPPATHTFADGVMAGFHASIRVNGASPAATGTGSLFASGRRLLMMLLAGATSNPIDRIMIGSSDAPMPDESIFTVAQSVGGEAVTHSEITTTTTAGDTVLLRASFQPNQARTIREIGAWSPGDSAPVGRATIPATTCEAGDLLTVEIRISFTSGG